MLQTSPRETPRRGTGQTRGRGREGRLLAVPRGAAARGSADARWALPWAFCRAQEVVVGPGRWLCPHCRHFLTGEGRGGRCVGSGVHGPIQQTRSWVTFPASALFLVQTVTLPKADAGSGTGIRGVWGYWRQGAGDPRQQGAAWCSRAQTCPHPVGSHQGP